MYAIVFLGSGSATPKLGIDLQGGTRVTLTATTPDGSPPSQESLKQAKAIIEDRVNGSGVTNAEVVQDGVNLVITVPGTDGEGARALGTTAELNFREVIQAVPAQATAADLQPAPPGGAPPPVPGSPAPGNATPANPVPGAPPASGAAPGDAPNPQGRVMPQQDTTAPNPAPSGAATVPSSAQSEAPAPPPGVADPKQLEKIEAAKKVRQNPALATDPQLQQQTLMDFKCEDKDSLKGFDDPNLPLITCGKKEKSKEGQEVQEKFLLGPVFLPGKLIDDAMAGPGQQGVGYEISLTFKPEGTKIWGDFTSKNVGKRSAFVLDSVVQSAPRVENPILGGATAISGSFTKVEAEKLANTLKYGALPLRFEPSSTETVSATLGLASLKAGLIAGGIGLLLVFIYCLFYYRALGLLTILSLILSGVVVYAVLVLLGRWMGFTLDLAGVAGFIIAIGITADSFIIYFEHIKDEIREGRTYRSAVPRAWARAKRTILSADAVSFLAAAVLYVLAIGQVKGFAFTLGMSTVLDLIVVFLVTHPLVIMASKSKWMNKPSISGFGSIQRYVAAHRKSTASDNGARPATVAVTAGKEA